jgi:hypothetical protein
MPARSTAENVHEHFFSAVVRLNEAKALFVT